jgi:hypothetical protein
MQQYPFKNAHNVPVAVFYCLDPRFRTQHTNFITEELGFGVFDQYVNPGGPKVLADETTRDFFLDAILKVSIGLHYIKEIVLIAHRDCGAYRDFTNRGGPVAEKAAQLEDMKLARSILQERFQGITVTTFYMEINGENVEFQSVK